MTQRMAQLVARRRRRIAGKRQRMWQAMRILREFSSLELMAACEIDAKSRVHTYLSKLRRAGYLRTRKGGWRQPATHQLVRDSGPHCPAIVRHGQAVYDPNTDTEYPL